MTRHALVTLQIGENPYFEQVQQNFQQTCQRYGWNFEVISSRKLSLLPLRKRIRRIQFEKFQIGSLLDTYERILYLDSDILIRPSFPDIFEIVPHDHFGCVMEDIGPLKWKRDEERIRAQIKLGTIESWTHGYFNSGMFVVSRIHQTIFSTKWRNIAGGRWPDQTTLNYQVRAHNYPIKELPIEFNYLPELCTDWDNPEKRRAAHIVHYAGPEAKPAMIQDLRTL